MPIARLFFDRHDIHVALVIADNFAVIDTSNSSGLNPHFATSLTAIAPAVCVPTGGFAFGAAFSNRVHVLRFGTAAVFLGN